MIALHPGLFGSGSKEESFMKTEKKTLFLAQFALLLAIEIVVCFTPLGSIPIGPIVATLAMIPVIITAILLGVGPGALMGGFAGLCSFLVMTFVSPSPTSFVFTPFYSVGDIHGNGWSLVICFVPRILTGVVAGLVFRLLQRALAKRPKAKPLPYILGGALGSLTNTALVMAGIYVFFGQSYAEAIGKSYDLLLALIGMTVLTNGVPEAVLGALCAWAVCYPIQKHLTKAQLG